MKGGQLKRRSGSWRFPEFLLEGVEPRLNWVVSSLPADLKFVIETTNTLDSFDGAVANVGLLSRESIDDGTERLIFELVEVPEKCFARLRIEKKEL